MLFPHKLLNSNLESITCIYAREVLVNFMDWFLKKMTGMMLYYLAYLFKDLHVHEVSIIMKISNATLRLLISLSALKLKFWSM
jgi:hypothetical protein